MKEASLLFMDKVSFEITESGERLEGAIRASMGAGQPKGTRVKPNDAIKKAIETRLDKFLESVMAMGKDLSQEKYDEAFYKTIDDMDSDAKQLDSGCKVSFGRFQKIINIWIKYHVVLAYAECDESQFGKYKALLPVAHIPVDSYVLNWLRKSCNGKDSADVAAMNGFGSWKWEMTKEQYISLQNVAREISREKNYCSPLELEMKEDIWKL